MVSFNRIKFGTEGYKTETLLKSFSVINSHFKDFKIFYWKILVFQGFQVHLVWFKAFQGFHGPPVALCTLIPHKTLITLNLKYLNLSLGLNVHKNAPFMPKEDFFRRLTYVDLKH